MKKRSVLIHVSDHAVLRWLQRECGVDVEAVRGHLEGAALTGAAYGAIAVRASKVKLVLKDNGTAPDGDTLVVVVTALPKSQVPHV